VGKWTIAAYAALWDAAILIGISVELFSTGNIVLAARPVETVSALNVLVMLSGLAANLFVAGDALATKAREYL
jgi:hypothetical protein